MSVATAATLTVTSAADPLVSFRTYAAAQPRQAALCHGGTTLNYGQLLASVERLASTLHADGMQCDDVVAVMAERSIATLSVLLAVLYGGGACLPLDPAYPRARLGQMLADARPRLLLASPLQPAPLPEMSGITLCSVDELAARAVAALRSPMPSTGELAYVLFTSGSSGRPKGVAMGRAALTHLIEWHIAHPRLGQSARTLQFAPLGFDVAFQELLSTLASGGTLVLPDDTQRRDPYALLALLAGERIARLFLPYVALQALAEAVAAGGTLPASLRDVVTAGEQLRITPAIRALFAALPGCVLHNHYGPTETHVVTTHELDGEASAWPELPPIGRPLPHVQVRVVDAALHAVAPGEQGELLLGGDCLAAGYLHQPELTDERFIEHGGARWYRTGDVASDAGDGVLLFHGRLDGQIKVDGYRVEPAEIEAVLAHHAAVAEVVVVATGEPSHRRLLACVVPRDMQLDDAALIAQLRRHAEAQLPAYLRPHGFVVRSALPLTPSGKIDRRALARIGDAAPLRWPEDASLPRQLAVLWEQLLDLSVIDPHANLFDLGARSLTVVRALTELRRRGHRTLTAVHIYEHSSVAKLAAWLSGEVAEPNTTARPRDDAAPRAELQARGDQQRAAFARFTPPVGAAS